MTTLPLSSRPIVFVILSTIVILSEAKDLVVEVFGCKSRSFASLRMTNETYCAG